MTGLTALLQSVYAKRLPRVGFVCVWRGGFSRGGLFGRAGVLAVLRCCACACFGGLGRPRRGSSVMSGQRPVQRGAGGVVISPLWAGHASDLLSSLNTFVWAVLGTQQAVALAIQLRLLRRALAKEAEGGKSRTRAFLFGFTVFLMPLSKACKLL